MVEDVDERADPVERRPGHVLRLARVEVRDRLFVAHQAASGPAQHDLDARSALGELERLDRARLAHVAARRREPGEPLRGRDHGHGPAGTFSETFASAFSLRTARSTAAPTA